MLVRYLGDIGEDEIKFNEHQTSFKLVERKRNITTLINKFIIPFKI